MLSQYLHNSHLGNQNVDNLLEHYQSCVIIANKRIGLITRVNTESVVKHLITESLLPLKIPALKLASPALDIGCGAGIPGIPLKIVRPEVSWTLLDANRRKISFIKSTLAQLNITDVEAIWGRIEDFRSDPINNEKYATITARGIPLDLVTETSLKLLRVGGELLLWKGSKTREEVFQEMSEGWETPDVLTTDIGLAVIRMVKIG